MKKLFPIFLLLLTSYFLLSIVVFAQPKPADCPKGATCLIVALPGVPQKITNPAEYIVGIYRFGLGIGGLFAMAIIVFAAIRRIAGAGNPSAIGEANDMIYNAIWGLVLLLGAFLILNTINPKLVELRTPVLPKVSTTGRGIAGIASDLKSQVSKYNDEIFAAGKKAEELAKKEEEAVAKIARAKTEKDKLASVIEANKILIERRLNEQKGKAAQANKISVEISSRHAADTARGYYHNVTAEEKELSKLRNLLLSDYSANEKLIVNLRRVIQQDEQKLADLK